MFVVTVGWLVMIGACATVEVLLGAYLTHGERRSNTATSSICPKNSGDIKCPATTTFEPESIGHWQHMVALSGKNAVGVHLKDSRRPFALPRQVCPRAIRKRIGDVETLVRPCLNGAVVDITHLNDIVLSPQPGVVGLVSLAADPSADCELRRAVGQAVNARPQMRCCR